MTASKEHGRQYQLSVCLWTHSTEPASHLRCTHKTTFHRINDRTECLRPCRLTHCRPLPRPL